MNKGKVYRSNGSTTANSVKRILEGKIAYGNSLGFQVQIDDLPSCLRNLHLLAMFVKSHFRISVILLRSCRMTLEERSRSAAYGDSILSSLFISYR